MANRINHFSRRNRCYNLVAMPNGQEYLEAQFLEMRLRLVAGGRSGSNRAVRRWSGTAGIRSPHSKASPGNENRPGRTRQPGGAGADVVQRSNPSTTKVQMKFIDPHIHCVSRTTDDYLYMARAGVVAVSEPAFWAGYDRSSRRQLRRLLSPSDGRRAQARRQVRHRALLLALHQCQGSGERRAVARSDQADPAAARSSARAGRRRDRPEQEHRATRSRFSKSRWISRRSTIN